MDVYSSHKCIFSLLASSNYSELLKRSVIEHSPKEVAHFLVEVCHNLLQHNLKLSSEQKKRLICARGLIRKIVSQKRMKDLLHSHFIRTLPILLTLVRKRFSDE